MISEAPAIRARRVARARTSPASPPLAPRATPPAGMSRSDAKGARSFGILLNLATFLSDSQDDLNSLLEKLDLDPEELVPVLEDLGVKKVKV